MRPVPVSTVARGRPFLVRYPQVAFVCARFARRADVIYATGTYAAAAAAARATRTPLVVKLVSDPAFERAYRYGWFTGSLEAFQEAPGARLRALKGLRAATLRTTRVVVPSRYLAQIAERWLSDPGRIDVLINPAPPGRGRPAGTLGPETFVYVGRLTSQKGLFVLLDALQAVEGAHLELVGEGPERPRLESAVAEAGLGDRVRFAGARPREWSSRTLQARARVCLRASGRPPARRRRGARSARP